MASLVGPIAYTRSESTPNFQVTISRQFEAADHLEATSPIAAGRILSRRSDSHPNAHARWGPGVRRRGKRGPPQPIGDPRSSASLRAGHVSSPFFFYRVSRRSQSRLSQNGPASMAAAGDMLRQRTLRAARRTRQTGNRESRAESGAGHGRHAAATSSRSRGFPRRPKSVPQLTAGGPRFSLVGGAPGAAVGRGDRSGKAVGR